MTALSVNSAVSQVLETDPMFETDQQSVDGVTYRVFKNIPSDLRALLQASRAPQGEGSADYLVFGNERWTYDEFCHDIKCVAQTLSEELGVGSGDRVAIAMQNCPEFLILKMAIGSIGAVAVLLNAWWTTEELDYALADTGATLIFADNTRAERLKPLISRRNLTLVGIRGARTTQHYHEMLTPDADVSWPDMPIDPDSDYAIIYSSGTTSAPKGVALTHRGAVNAVFSWLLQAVIAPLITPPEDGAAPAPRPVTLITTPLFHVTASHPGFLLSLPAGAKVVLMDKWNAETAVSLIEKEDVTRFVGVPTQSADLRLASRGNQLKTLKSVLSGGAKRPASQVQELADMFPQSEIGTGWGMTETNALGIGLAGQEYIDNPDATGRLYPPLQDVKFLDDDGNEVPDGQVGEMVVKSVTNMRCYLNKPEETLQTLRDGWLHTGDLARIDEAGIITIVDRKKNIIIRGGENIACLDVEGALHQHPDVLEACAFSVPHDRLGEVVGASLQVSQGSKVTLTEIYEYLSDHIARFKIPEHLWVQDDPLPRGATDKIDRRTIRAVCLASHISGTQNV